MKRGIRSSFAQEMRRWLRNKKKKKTRRAMRRRGHLTRKRKGQPQEPREHEKLRIKEQVRIGTLNCRGLKEGTKTRDIQEWMNNKKLSFLGLQETHNENIDKWNRGDFIWYLSSGVKDNDKKYRKETTHAQRVREGKTETGLERHGV